MPTLALPPELKAALDQKIEGVSRNDAARRANAISNTYRAGGTSAPIRTETDALAYALARMPATYAATAACLHALQEIAPGFAPRRLLDVGAGPGTATWAAAEIFSSLDTFNLLDANTALRALAMDLAAESHRLSALRYQQGDAAQLIANAEPADLIIASYVINELGDAARDALADAMWAKTKDMLAIVEPGTPEGYARIIALRARLITQGAHVVAPCPHDNACPLQAPDWCHFVQRLPRSRAHKHLKAANLPYEDEKFCYIVVSHTAPATRPSRVLAQPARTKVAVTAKVCAPHGLEIVSAPHRDKAFYARARKWDWGDTIVE